MPTTELSFYNLLGRTGLRVSPLALGTMTFGMPDWGAGEEASRQLFRRYLDAGGNFIDTANIYAYGRSEELLGQFIDEADCRDQLVIATKFTSSRRAGDPNAGGNGRKNIIASLEESLRRLRTDYVDLYWLHVWDTVTPVEEVMSTFDALIRSGKVRAIGLSDTPAWYATKAQMLAFHRGWEPVAALQLEYSLVERNIEREHVPAALELGAAVVPWSPLASGFLSGKYERAASGTAGEGRLRAFEGTDHGRQHSDRDWDVVDTLVDIAKQVDRSAAQVALNWVMQRPAVTSTLIGARTVEQLDDNLAASSITLDQEHLARLEEVGRPPVQHPHDFYRREFVHGVHGGTDVRGGLF